ncbi:MAG: glycosyltransferase family 2 protein, partial [Chloroflexota bacterium]
FSTLPQGVARGLGQALHGEPSGLARAAMIGIGFGATAAGYLVGSVRRRMQRAAAFRPGRPLEETP